MIAAAVASTAEPETETTGTKRPNDFGDSSTAKNGPPIRPQLGHLNCDEFWDLCDKISLLELDDDQPPVDFTVWVKTLMGKSVPITIDVNTTVSQFKQKIQDREGISPDQQRLLHNGHQIFDDKANPLINHETSMVRHHHVLPGDTIHLVLRLRGGMFADTSGRFIDGEGRPVVSNTEDPPQLVRAVVFTSNTDQQTVLVPVHMQRFLVEDLIAAVRKAAGYRAYLGGSIMVDAGKQLFETKSGSVCLKLMSEIGVTPGCRIEFLKE
jgi:hypothetical protein